VQEEVSAATAMLGLDGFVLLAVSEYDGELEQAIETRPRFSGAAAAVCRPGCMTGVSRGCGTCLRVVGR
jgi:hypothetical protein